MHIQAHIQVHTQAHIQVHKVRTREIDRENKRTRTHYINIQPYKEPEKNTCFTR